MKQNKTKTNMEKGIRSAITFHKIQGIVSYEDKEDFLTLVLDEAKTYGGQTFLINRIKDSGYDINSIYANETGMKIVFRNERLDCKL